MVCTWLINPLDVPLAHNCATQYCARQEFEGSVRLAPVFAVYTHEMSCDGPST